MLNFVFRARGNDRRFSKRLFVAIVPCPLEHVPVVRSDAHRQSFVTVFSKPSRRKIGRVERTRSDDVRFFFGFPESVSSRRSVRSRVRSSRFLAASQRPETRDVRSAVGDFQHSFPAAFQDGSSARVRPVVHRDRVELGALTFLEFFRFLIFRVSKLRFYDFDVRSVELDDFSLGLRTYVEIVLTTVTNRNRKLCKGLPFPDVRNQRNGRVSSGAKNI